MKAVAMAHEIDKFGCIDMFQNGLSNIYSHLSCGTITQT